MTTPTLDIQASASLWHWLHDQHISLALTTYQTNRLFFIGCKPEPGRLAIHERLFDKPMGLYWQQDTLTLGCRYQIWQLANRLPVGDYHEGGDRLYVPRLAYITGDLNAHDLTIDGQGRILFVNTDFSCLATLDPNYSFVPIWRPPFIRKPAIVGLSQLRSTSFGGLALEHRLATASQGAQCGFVVINLNSGALAHWLRFAGIVTELFDLVVLPDTRQPRALGLQDDDIERLVTFPEAPGIVITKPTVKRPGQSAPVPVAGLPRPPANAATIRYQRVYSLTPDNLLPYDRMTYPRLQQRWLHQPPRGDLFGLSAAIAGEMIGLAVAERFEVEHAPVAELCSLYVLPAYRHQGIATRLIKELQHSLGLPLKRPSRNDL